jgi:ATP-dependent RNA helicase DDX21
MSPALATAEPMAVDDSASKKAKRKELKAAAAAAEAEAASSRKKEKKKRKAKEPSPPPSDEEDSSTSSEEPAPAVKKAKKEKKSAEEKARSSSEDGGDGDVTACSDKDPADPNALTNFRICEPLRQSLKSKGIKALFPIQASTFDLVFDGCDLVGRARTGQVRSPFELCLVSFLRFSELISAYSIGHL